MKTTKKSKVLLTLALGVAMAVSVGVMQIDGDNVKVSADITVDATTNIASDGFYMSTGASVRKVNDEAGIRWETNVTDEFVNYIETTYAGAKVEYRTLITAVNLPNRAEEVTISDMTVENVETLRCNDTKGALEDGKYYGSVLYKDDTVEDWANLTDAELRVIYATELVARSYVEITPTSGEPVVIYAKAEDTARSMRAVANAAQIDGDASTLLTEYVGKAETQTTRAGVYNPETDNGNVALELNELGDKAYVAYVGAKLIGNVNVANNEAMVRVDGIADGEHVINLFDENANVYRAPFVKATKVIDDKSELAMFTITDATMSTDSYIESATSFDGYYVLGKDIDASGYTHQVATGTIRDNLKSLSLVGGRAHNGGLKGVFDGNGYTISNLTVGHHGLFGVIYGGTVKNVAFTNVTLKGDTHLENLSMLAEQMVDGTLENVYIQANEIIGGDQINNAEARGNRALLATMAYGKTTMENCIFQYDIEGTKKKYARSYGLIAYESTAKYNKNYPGGSSVDFSNVYVISNAMISAWNGSAVYKDNSTITLGENETNETGLTLAQLREVRRAYVYEQLGGASNTIDISETTITGDRINRYTGMYRYATAQAMQDANNDYTSFDNGYWTVTEGQIPSFKSHKMNVLGTYYLDTSEGKFSAEDTAKIFGASTAVIETAKIGATEYTVTDGKITGVPVDNNGTVVQMAITLKNDKTVYNVSVVPATKIIYDKSELAMFTITGATMSTDTVGYIESATSFDGYYVLGKDIDASGYTHQVATGTVRDNLKSLSLVGERAHNGGLKGVFDGNGYTISNLSVGHHGLFGLIYGGTVKNVAFTNVTLKGDTKEENLSFLAEQMVDGTLENVYIQANQIIGGNGTTNSAQSFGNRALLATMAYGKTTITNCIFKYDIEGTQKQYARSYGLIGYESTAKYNTKYPLGSSVDFSDVYVISNAMISSWNPSLVYKNNSTITLGENETNETGLTLEQWREVRRAYVYEQLGGTSNTKITETTITGDRINRYTGMYRYATAKAMQDANNDYSAFENDYWKVTAGQIPVWD